MSGLGTRGGLRVLAAALVLAAAPVAAFVPKPERALAAVAQANVTSGRTQPIQLDLVMRVGDEDAIATGRLVTHPSGLARLELRGAGRVDRYLLSGPELLAARDGEPLSHPQPMLQPVFLLQPASQETLAVALESFGVDARMIGLAPCGELDCYVFGDPALAASLPKRPLGEPFATAPGAAGDPATSGTRAPGTERRVGLFDRPEEDETPRGPARLWVDTETLQIQRVDRETGVSLQLGPLSRFERLMVPAWLEIHEPGEPVIRFDVKRAVRVNATPQAFNPSWLYGPVDPTDPTGQAGPPALAAPQP